MEENSVVLNGSTKLQQPSISIEDERYGPSESANEIISTERGFLEQWGLAICIVTLFICFSMTWFIKYPDIITSRATLWAENGPKEIIPRQSARLVRLLVKNNENVNQKDIIAWVESSASHEEVIKLSAFLDSTAVWVEEGEFSKLSWAFKKKFDKLGELQENYRNFIVSLQQFCDYKVNGFYPGLRDLIEKDVQSLDRLRQTIGRKKHLIETSLELSKESFNMNESLMEQKVLSLEQFRIEKRNYISQEAVIPELEASLIQNDALQREKHKALMQITHDLSKQETIFLQALHTFRSLVDDWMRKYLLISPVSGRVFFVIPLQENQSVTSGDVIGYISPDDTKYFVRTYLSQNNFGKIKVGQKAQLRFDAYPYNEVGSVEGTLEYISKVPTDSGFLATIKLDRGMITNNHYLIPYKSGLKMDALIITENMRLLKRLFYNIIKRTAFGKN